MKGRSKKRIMRVLSLVLGTAVALGGNGFLDGNEAAAKEIQLQFKGNPVSAEEEKDMELKLWYDEPARASFGEIYASKYSICWQLDPITGEYINVGDGWLEVGRSDGANYKDGQNNSNSLTMDNLDTKGVTPFVESGVAWAKHALPIGNGRMGAMTFGYTDTERVQMNEDTLWTGGPNHKRSSSNTGDAYGIVTLDDPAGTMANMVDVAFEEFYESMKTGIMPNAGTKASPNENGYTPNSKEQEGSYQSFAEMFLDFNIPEKETTDYERYLDLRTAISGVNYTYDGVAYERTMFASYPDEVMVYKIDASEGGKVSFTLRPEIPQMEMLKGRYLSTSGDGTATGKTGSVVADGDTITLKGSLNHNGMQFMGKYKVVTEGGTVQASNEGVGTTNLNNGTITVSGADSAYIIISLETDYVADFDKNYVTGETLNELSEKAEAIVEAAAAKGYDQLLTNHLEDYQELFSRVELQLGVSEMPDMPTDKLMKEYRANYKAIQAGEKGGEYNHYLEMLYYQYGRYLLIASSRDNSLPANLQGIWNDTDMPAWSSDYHTNINVQMNYWPAESTNLAETATALVNFCNALRKPGRLSLAKLYGIGYEKNEASIDLETEDGFIFFCNTTPLGFTGNIKSEASFTATATAFIAQNLYDYYAFTKDLDYLRSDIYPFLRESCITYLQTLQAGRSESDRDKLYVVPSWSSEQNEGSHKTPWTVGTYFDQQLVWQLFHDTLCAMEDMGITPAENMEDEGDDTFKNNDSKLMAKLQDAIDRLDPVAVGSDNQIKEWQQEDKYNTTSAGNTIGTANHRHISQLMAVYPGNYVSNAENAEELKKAAQVVLTNRTDVSTGWGLAYRLNCWARTGDGDHSYRIVNAMLGSTTYDNLFDTHAPFQIDGNFGGTAGITEMLLQSESDTVELLPALPGAWSSGSVKGLVARGNFEVSMDWKDSKVQKASILSNKGGELKLDGMDIYCIADESGKLIECTINKDGSLTWNTEEGKIYYVYADKELYKAEFPDEPEPDPIPEPEPPVYDYGDVDRDKYITTDDAMLVLQYSVNKIKLDEEQILLADIDRDGIVSTDDAMFILQHAVKS